jgi:hypothetical protein
MKKRTIDSASGTLVIVIPTVDGLVVAADSRTRFRDKFYDCREKLHVSATRAPIVFAITGSGEFPWSVPPGVDPEESLRNGPFAFRGRDSVLAYLERDPDWVISNTGLESIGKELATGFSKFLACYPAKARDFIGKNICLLVLCQIAPVSGELLVGSIAIGIDPNQIACPKAPWFSRFTPPDATDSLFFGARDYVVDHVQHGAGRQFLSQDAESIWSGMGIVQNLRAHEAARLARSIIAATEKISETTTIPDGIGIGGPVSCRLVTVTSAEAI